MRTAGELPEKDRVAVGLPRKLIVIVQRPDRGRREWQVVRPLDQAQTRRHLVEQKSVADPPARRHVKDDVLRSPPLQSIELDHIVEGRHVADVARPDLIEHAIGQTRHPERLRLRKVALVGAGKQRGRVAHAAEPLVEANGAEKIFFGRARSGMQDTLHPVPRLLMARKRSLSNRLMYAGKTLAVLTGRLSRLRRPAKNSPSSLSREKRPMDAQ